MLTFEDLKAAFTSPRTDHPGRKGGPTMRRGSGSAKKGGKWWTSKHIRIHGDKYAELKTGS